MNLMNKTTPWVAGLLIAATSVFGDDKPSQSMQMRRGCGDTAREQPMKPKPPLVPGYNASSRIDVRGSWDIYGSASFIYWQL